MSDKKIGCVNHDCDKCTKAELPVLPEPSMIRSYGNPYAEGYTADQLQAYGAACAAHAREQVLIGNNAAWKLMCEKMAADNIAALQSQAERIKILEGQSIEVDKVLARENVRLRDQLAEIAATEPVGHISNQDTHDGRELIKIFANDAGRSLPRGKHLLFTRPMPPQIIGLQDVHDAVTVDPSLADGVTELVELLEFMWREVSMNDYAFEKLEAALSKYRGAK